MEINPTGNAWGACTKTSKIAPKNLLLKLFYLQLFQGPQHSQAPPYCSGLPAQNSRAGPISVLWSYHFYLLRPLFLTGASDLVLELWKKIYLRRQKFGGIILWLIFAISKFNDKGMYWLNIVLGVVVLESEEENNSEVLLWDSESSLLISWRLGTALKTCLILALQRKICGNIYITNASCQIVG